MCFCLWVCVHIDISKCHKLIYSRCFGSGDKRITPDVYLSKHCAPIPPPHHPLKTPRVVLYLALRSLDSPPAVGLLPRWFDGLVKATRLEQWYWESEERRRDIEGGTGSKWECFLPFHRLVRPRNRLLFGQPMRWHRTSLRTSLRTYFRAFGSIYYDLPAIVDGWMKGGREGWREG